LERPRWRDWTWWWWRRRAREGGKSSGAQKGEEGEQEFRWSGSSSQVRLKEAWREGGREGGKEGKMRWTTSE